MDKKSKWLTEAEAVSLFLRPKTPKDGRNQARYQLTADEWQSILRGRNSGIIEAHQEHGIDPTLSKFLWLKNKNSSIPVQNPLYVPQAQADQQEFFDKVIEDLQQYAPKFPKIKRKKCKDGHLLVVDPADIHIGKLALAIETGEEYNSQIAVQRSRDGVKGILDKASGFNIDKICFVGGNDILHTDNTNRTTTGNTPQDTDSMWYDNFNVAKKLYIELLEMLISVADVHFVFNPSNHDYMTGFFLADVIKTHFRNCKNITFDTSIAHRKYFNYGNSLIGTTHGDGAKQQDLGSLMSIEAKDHWATAEHRYFYTHHVHHKTSKDFINVTVESLRSPSGADSWHAKKGYKGGVKAVEGFIHSKENGQIARLTNIF